MGSGLDVLEDMETTEEGEDGKDGDGPCVKRTRQVRPRLYVSQAPWPIMLRKANLKRRDSREARNFRRNLIILYELFFEFLALAK